MYYLYDVKENEIVVHSTDLKFLLFLRMSLIDYLSKRYHLNSDPDFIILQVLDLKTVPPEDL